MKQSANLQTLIFQATKLRKAAHEIRVAALTDRRLFHGASARDGQRPDSILILQASILETQATEILFALRAQARIRARVQAKAFDKLTSPAQTCCRAPASPRLTPTVATHARQALAVFGD